MWCVTVLLGLGNAFLLLLKLKSKGAKSIFCCFKFVVLVMLKVSWVWRSCRFATLGLDGNLLLILSLKVLSGR